MAKVTARKLSADEIFQAAEVALVMQDNDELMRIYYEKYDTETWRGDREDRRRTYFQTAINEHQPLAVRKAAFRKLCKISVETEYFSRHPEIPAMLLEE